MDDKINGRMKYVINSYNTISAGTANVTKGLLQYLLKQKIRGKMYFVLPDLDIYRDAANHPGDDRRQQIVPVSLYHGQGLINVLIRFFYDLLFFPLFCLYLRPISVLIMANYAPIKLWGKKIVIMRHPYLVDNKARAALDWKTKVYELMREALFRMTLRSTSTLIVQSEYMRAMLLRKYNPKNTKIVTLPNPTSCLLRFTQGDYEKGNNSEKIILYVSRYYPHKNHEFILKLAKKYFDQLRAKNIKIYVTLDVGLGEGVRRFLDQVEKEKLAEVIVNIGEIAQVDLQEYYQKAAALFFPSKSETFGNPLVEAMGFGLPVIVPDTGYARAICEDAGAYYQEDNEEEAFSLLVEISERQEVHDNYSQKSIAQFKKFPTIEEWIEVVFDLMGVQKAALDKPRNVR